MASKPPNHGRSDPTSTSGKSPQVPPPRYRIVPYHIDAADTLRGKGASLLVPGSAHGQHRVRPFRHANDRPLLRRRDPLTSTVTFFRIASAPHDRRRKRGRWCRGNIRLTSSEGRLPSRRLLRVDVHLPRRSAIVQMKQGHRRRAFSSPFR